MPRRTNRSHPSYGTLFKTAFVTGAGTFMGLVPQLVLGMLLFLSAPRGDGADPTRYYAGMALMLLGSAFALGFGGAALLEEV